MYEANLPVKDFLRGHHQHPELKMDPAMDNLLPFLKNHKTIRKHVTKVTGADEFKPGWTPPGKNASSNNWKTMIDITNWLTDWIID